MNRIRILVVDDSPFMRKALERMLSAADDLEVVGSARDGEDALEKIPQLKPDMVTLDVEMPRMDGLTCLKHIMQRHPLPVLMVSSQTQDGASATMEALALGALDFIPKESSLASASILQIQQDLHEKIRKLASSPKFRKSTPAPPPLMPPATGSAAQAVPSPSLFTPTRPVPKPARTGTLSPGPRAELMAIGCSTGGPKALQDFLPGLPAGLPVPCLVVQHMPATFTKAFADRLDGLCQVRVKEAEDGEPLKAGTVYIAPGGIHMLLRPKGGIFGIELNPEPATSLHRPSVDVMFQSLVEHYPRQILSLILTGMGSDGARGMESLKRKGAHTLAESEESCVVYGMPKAAVERGCVDEVAPISQMAGIVRRHFGI